MWVIGSIFYLVPVVAIAIHLLSPQSRRTPAVAIARRKHRQSRSHSASICCSLPLIGSLLRARYGRMALQSVAFVAAVLVIADGFLGHPMGAMNLAGVLPWTYVRAFGVIALWCWEISFACRAPSCCRGSWGTGLGLARFKWPRWLRSKWIAIALMILFFWSYEAFAIWDHPAAHRVASDRILRRGLPGGYLFSRGQLLQVLCPLGQFNFAGSLLSPFTLAGDAARQPASAAPPTTASPGTQQQRGCELQLYMPQKAGNMDCTLCMDCVKACPHDNIGLFAVAPVRDVLRDPVRSSIGRFSSRIDIAVLVWLW